MVSPWWKAGRAPCGGLTLATNTAAPIRHTSWISFQNHPGSSDPGQGEPHPSGSGRSTVPQRRGGHGEVEIGGRVRRGAVGEVPPFFGNPGEAGRLHRVFEHQAVVVRGTLDPRVEGESARVAAVEAGRHVARAVRVT